MSIWIIFIVYVIGSILVARYIGRETYFYDAQKLSTALKEAFWYGLLWPLAMFVVTIVTIADFPKYSIKDKDVLAKKLFGKKFP